VMTRPPLGELLTAMVTPFAADGTVDHGATRRMARHLIDHGSDGLVVCGTTGEGPTVNDREKLDLFETVVTEVGSTATVVANTGTYDTHHSVALTRSALAAGVDGFLVVTPYYNKPPVEGIVRHFEAIAEAAEGRPVIVYNIPSRVIINLEPPVLERLAEIPNVVAVKQATPDIDQAEAIVRHGGLQLYAGNDDLLGPFLRLGGVGGICVASHIAGVRMREMISAAAGGDFDRVDQLDHEIAPLLEALAVTTNPIPLKAALNLLGHEVGGVRLPLVDADEPQTATIQAALEAAGLLPIAAA
jgi:4-hydroxy-tetrahydrodipicolinate synthase